VAAAVLISFFPVLVNTVKGLKVPEADFQDLFRAMRADPAQIFRKLRIPYCLPYFFSALKISSSLAIVRAIVLGRALAHAPNIFEQVDRGPERGRFPELERINWRRGGYPPSGAAPIGATSRSANLAEPSACQFVFGSAPKGGHYDSP
jgi:hypothetical protein